MGHWDHLNCRDLVDQQAHWDCTLGRRLAVIPGLSSLSLVPRRISWPYPPAGWCDLELQRMTVF
jgi:hypothetical protein